LTAPPRSRRKRILCWTACLVVGSCLLYVLAAYMASPFFESRLLGGQHPDLIIKREWDPKWGQILTIRDDLPSTCNCPLHQMLAGKEVVTVGWSRFSCNAEESMEKGKEKQIKFGCHDLAPERFIMLTRLNDDEIEVHLFEQWNPAWTLRQTQDVVAGMLRYVYR